MGTILQPIYLAGANEREVAERREQTRIIAELYQDDCTLLPEIELGAPVPADADAVVFCQMIGSIFEHPQELCEMDKPILVMTSRFGTVEMWDWEIVSWMREELALAVFTPYNIELGRVVLRALGAKKSMRTGARFLMFQNEPGEGQQAYIFKRFYWWTQQSAQRIEAAFGVKVIYHDWKAVNERAQAVPDAEAEALWQRWAVPTEQVTQAQLLPAVKLYIAIKRVIDELGGVEGVGANCLNESFHSCTTPCLAWNWLFEHDGIVWACEGDTVTLISKFVLYSALRKPMMMTNIYPFLVGMAALEHEKIHEFPNIEDPDNHALGVHCGYFGFAPQQFCESWTLRPRVLEIVDENALMVDCRMKRGPITMAKLHANMKTLTVIEAEIEDYVQYPGSDCRNGALIRYRNNSGHKVMESLSSHHAILIEGDVTPALTQLARVYGLSLEVI